MTNPPDNHDPPTHIDHMPTLTNQHPDQRTRDGKGRYTRSMTTVERDAEAARLRTRGHGYREIGELLGFTTQAAHEAVKRAMAEAIAEPAAAVRDMELGRLDTMYVAVLEILERKHVTISQGGIVQIRVLDEDGQPILIGHDPETGRPIYKETDLLDDKPALEAVDRLLKIQARRAALLGLDSPVKAEAGVVITYQIPGIDMTQI